ncbi:recombinase family protein [Microbacterium hydrocarbonoxydans]|uniref:recombinase family protein n=1 Tax=Microbacterium hydrocarbonoxydans TaxID=273678 RepID=UPI00203FD168|nr:recombinase family protein [Microbacterium hydrocarbonoxydans]MCM3778132.1 recombinase family protein [Microbacterium hydrocarbonoxydans]
MSETIDPTRAAASVEEPLTSPLHLPHAAAECPKCFTELQQNRNFWLARPDGSRLVGLVVSRDDMPSVVEQRDDLTRFGVPIEGFRHPAPDILESWNDRLTRLIATLNKGDVLVVANIRALGRDADEGARTVAELRRHGIIVKVLSHNARHLADAAATR